MFSMSRKCIYKMQIDFPIFSNNKLKKRWKSLVKTCFSLFLNLKHNMHEFLKNVKNTESRNFQHFDFFHPLCKVCEFWNPKDFVDFICTNKVTTTIDHFLSQKSNLLSKDWSTGQTLKSSHQLMFMVQSSWNIQFWTRLLGFRFVQFSK